MAGMAYLVPRKTPVLLTAMTSSHLSGSLFNGGAADNTGIVHQDVQPPVAVHGCANGFAPVVFAGHVQVHVCRFTSHRPDVGLNLSAGIVQHIAKDHPGTFTCK